MQPLVVVSCDAVVEGSQVLVEFTDGSFKVYRWAPFSSSDSASRLRWLTPEQVLSEVSLRLHPRATLPRGYNPPSSIAGAAFWR